MWTSSCDLSGISVTLKPRGWGLIILCISMVHTGHSSLSNSLYSTWYQHNCNCHFVINLKLYLSLDSLNCIKYYMLIIFHFSNYTKKAKAVSSNYKLKRGSFCVWFIVPLEEALSTCSIFQQFHFQPTSTN